MYTYTTQVTGCGTIYSLWEWDHLCRYTKSPGIGTIHVHIYYSSHRERDNLYITQPPGVGRSIVIYQAFGRGTIYVHIYYSSHRESGPPMYQSSQGGAIYGAKGGVQRTCDTTTLAFNSGLFTHDKMTTWGGGKRTNETGETKWKAN